MLCHVPMKTFCLKCLICFSPTRYQAISKGVFVALVHKGTPAAKVGLRFGDQILQVNGENVAGYSNDKVHGIFKKCTSNNIVVAVRDR